jgi:hypothetical protein
VPVFAYNSAFERFPIRIKKPVAIGSHQNGEILIEYDRII